MMKTGHVEKTNDRDYEVEERRFRTMEAASLRLQKEAKGYLDSLRAMTASQMRIAETIDAFYGDAGAKDGVSRSYKQAVEDLDAETIKALDGPYRYCLIWHQPMREKTSNSLSRTTVLEPINRFCAYFPDVNECKPGLTTLTLRADILIKNRTQASRNAATNYWITMRYVPRSRSWPRSPTRTLPSFLVRRRRWKSPEPPTNNSMNNCLANFPSSSTLECHT